MGNEKAERDVNGKSGRKKVKIMYSLLKTHLGEFLGHALKVHGHFWTMPKKDKILNIFFVTFLHFPSKDF